MTVASPYNGGGRRTAGSATLQPIHDVVLDTVAIDSPDYGGIAASLHLSRQFV